MLLSELKSGLSHLFFPVLCEGCKKPLAGSEAVLCIGCEAQLPETGYHHIPDNETALRFAGRIPFYYATSFAYFTDDGLLQHLVHGLKYSNKKDTGTYLGRLFAKQLTKTEWIKEIDMVIPVPLHKAKEAKRGYNQSTYIAEGISSVTGIPVNEAILRRNRETESQTKKSRTERVNNMSGAFGITAPEPLKEKHILLVDDVLTTGATIESCALALMEEKSIKISVATIGIAVS